MIVSLSAHILTYREIAFALRPNAPIRSDPPAASREVMESQMHKLEQDAWVRASELKSLHKEHETLVEDNKRLSQQAEQLRLAKDKLIEDKTQVMMRLAEVESELKKTGTEVSTPIHRS